MADTRACCGASGGERQERVRHPPLHRMRRCSGCCSWAALRAPARLLPWPIATASWCGSCRRVPGASSDSTALVWALPSQPEAEVVPLALGTALICKPHLWWSGCHHGAMCAPAPAHAFLCVPCGRVRARIWPARGWRRAWRGFTRKACRWVATQPSGCWDTLGTRPR